MEDDEEEDEDEEEIPSFQIPPDFGDSIHETSLDQSVIHIDPGFFPLRPTKKTKTPLTITGRVTSRDVLDNFPRGIRATSTPARPAFTRENKLQVNLIV